MSVCGWRASCIARIDYQAADFQQIVARSRRSEFELRADERNRLRTESPDDRRLSRGDEKMQEEFSLSGEPDLNVIARLPNVLLPKKDDLSEICRRRRTRLQFALDDLEKCAKTKAKCLKTS
jgi:hypothetical protein